MRYRLLNLIPVFLLALSVGLLAPSHVVWHSAHGHCDAGVGATDAHSDHRHEHSHAHSHASALSDTHSSESGDSPFPASSHEEACQICLIMLSLLVIAIVAWRSRLRLSSFRFPDLPAEQPVVTAAGIIWRRGPPA